MKNKNREMLGLFACHLVKRLWCLVICFLGIDVVLANSDLDWLPEGFPEGNGSMLCQRSFLTPEMGAEVLSATLEAFDEKAKWELYRSEVRAKILKGAGLDPLPNRVPLNAILHSLREYDGYSVENIALESVPGFWITGNLYRPLGKEGPSPAILSTHGHSRRIEDPEDWQFHGRFHEQSQRRAIGLAKMGALVFSIDMFGYGDGIKLVGQDAHKTAVAMRIQLWNAMRAVDYLELLPEVDANRIGVTGASGGGTQAFLLAAVDDRIAASVPVVMVSSYFFGGCPCESGRPIHRSDSHFVSNPMIAAMAAPRPQLLVSVGGDWTVNTPKVEYPFVRSIYKFYGAAENVGNVHFSHEGHDYGPSKRKAVYAFFEKELGLDTGAIDIESGGLDDTAFSVEPPELMRVFDAAHPLPAGASRDVASVERSIDSLQ